MRLRLSFRAESTGDSVYLSLSPPPPSSLILSIYLSIYPSIDIFSHSCSFHSFNSMYSYCFRFRLFLSLITQYLCLFFFFFHIIFCTRSQPFLTGARGKKKERKEKMTGYARMRYDRIARVKLQVHACDFNNNTCASTQPKIHDLLLFFRGLIRVCVCAREIQALPFESPCVI